MHVRQGLSLDQRIARLREDIKLDRLIISRSEADRQLKALLAERAAAR